jgi:poly(3-hydroxybutyrate) depolymerase
MPEIAPYGSWKSPISASMVAAGRTPIDAPRFAGDSIYWIEGRPLEGGRYVIMRRHASGTSNRQLTPEGFNVRSRVHEYGGGAYAVYGTAVYFVNFADQQLYRQAFNGQPQAVTDDSSARYADMCLSPDGRWIYCVREKHGHGEPVNDIVALPSGGSEPLRVIASGRDFYAFPRLSPDGSHLAWTCWDHPNMPWDGTELWLANADGSNARKVAGGPEESIFQPSWSPDGRLHWVSDKTGWWNLYREGEALWPMAAEFGTPQWVFGLSTYGFLGDGRIACLHTRDSSDHLTILDSVGKPQVVDLPYTAFAAQLQASGSRLAFIAASPTEPASLIALDLSTGQPRILKRSVDQTVDAGYVSQPRAIEFPTGNGLTAHAIFYPPANSDFAAPAGERPPLLVLSHGGPTSQAKPTFDLGIQFWTSRGFAVVDVNYGGSSGYGREYRLRLNGQWDIVDVDDCVNAARYLADQGEVDGRRLAIRGGSAGGYTTLCALTFRDDFSAGASYYGVADCQTLATDTHKFESRYLEVMPPDTNRGPSFPGQPIRMGGRKPVAPTCRDEVLAALAGLSDRAGGQVFTVRQVYAEMVARGTAYAQVTVSKTMQRMKEEPVRPPYGRLERVGRRGFQLARG